MSDLTEIVNSFVGPIIFIAICIFIFAVSLVVVYYTLLRRYIPEKPMILVGFVGAVGILILCTDNGNFEWIRGFTKNFL